MVEKKNTPYSTRFVQWGERGILKKKIKDLSLIYTKKDITV